MKSRREIWADFLKGALGSDASPEVLDAIEALDDTIRHNHEKMEAMYLQNPFFALKPKE